MIPYGKQDIRQDDIDAVIRVLKSDFLTQGPKGPEFEQAMARKIGANHAVAVNSATSALHIACLALGLGPGDRFWTTPVTFVATANCALYCGAKVDFVDIDPATYNMSVEALRVKLEHAELLGGLPKIVAPVDMCGQSCDLAGIRELADKYGFAVLEDASHAVGGKYRNHYVGDGKFSDITVFSFHPVKIITTAEGGMALTNNAQLAEKMAYLRTHGIVRDQALMTEDSHGPWYYQQIDLGYNYRMTELQSALGLTQLDRLDEYVAARAALAARYDQALSSFPLKPPYQAPDTASAWHLYVIRLEDAEKHRSVFEALRNDGVGVNLHYIPVHTQPYYRKLGFSDGDFPEAESYYREAISIPLYATMTHAEQDEVVAALARALSS